MTENVGNDQAGGSRNPKADAKAAKAYAKASRPWYKQKRWWAVGVIAIFVIAGAASGGTETVDQGLTAAGDSVESSESESPSESDASTEGGSGSEADEEPEPKKDPVPPEPELTSGQENAVRSAEQYLSISGYSRSGLIDQLKFEGYSEKDAAFGVDYLKINYKEEAVRSADNYLSISGYSEAGLIEQLEFEGYTTPQATYGAKQALG